MSAGPSSAAGSVGRYSFLTADPVDTLIASVDGPDPWPTLQAWADSLPKEHADGLPRFQGGIAGVIGYEAATWLEPVGQASIDDLPTPAISLGLYDWTIATDHQTGESWVISQGLGVPQQQRHRTAADRADAVIVILTQSDPVSSAQPDAPPVATGPPSDDYYTAQHDQSVWSNFTATGYHQAVQEIIDRIRRGDSFQVNLSQRLLSPITAGSPELYLRLRRVNPAPYCGYYSGTDTDGNEFQVLSSSPEGFLQIRDRQVVTRPIKGTVPRTGQPEQDQMLAAQLLGSEKDRAENTMIVDLMRNDLSRVCADESVKVTRLCGLEQYECVQHLVSVVRGELAPDRGPVDALMACFPGGSVTGAPKIEAMRTIAELEPHRRGPYCGSMGYISCGGSADFNILIRTITATAGYWQIPVGGGVTARSDPAGEEAETWAKSQGMLRALMS